MNCSDGGRDVCCAASREGALRWLRMSVLSSPALKAVEGGCQVTEVHQAQRLACGEVHQIRFLRDVVAEGGAGT